MKAGTSGVAEQGPTPTVAMISQRNCEAVIGTKPRRYLEIVRRHPELPRLNDGKLVLVPLASIIALARPAATTKANDAAGEADQVDALLAELGERRVRGRR